MSTAKTGARAGSAGSPARDIPSKAAGVTEYLTDRRVPGCLWAALVRSPYPRADVLAVDTAAMLATEGVVAAFTSDDVPATRYNPALTPADAIAAATRDKQMLTRHAHHVGDAVAVVVATSRAAAHAAARQAHVRWAPGDTVLDVAAALAGRVKGRLAHGQEQAAARMATAAITVRDTFGFAAAQHVCLETSACIARPAGAGGVEIWSNTQSPAEVRSRLAAILDLDETAVRVRKIDEGGGFGAKQELYDEPLAAWLALRLLRPIRFAHTRAEELAAGRVRAAGTIDLRLGFDRSGRMLAAETSAVLDSGAYASHTPYVLGCIPGHLAAVYPRTAHGFRGKVVVTDTIPAGAYRGYGVAESCFAVEQLMDVAAARLGLDPVAIRLHNLVTDRDGRGAAACLQTAAAAAAARPLPADHGDLRWGRGYAVAAKHSVTGDESDRSTAEVTLEAGPTVVLTTGTCDSGTGSSGALARIVAEEIGCPVSRVTVREGDTDDISDLGSTAQRSVYVGGAAARQAARAAVAAIVRAGSDHRDDLRLQWPFLVETTGRPVVDLADLARSGPPGGIGARATARPDGRGASYCALAVEVSVDVGTGSVRVSRADAVIDCGGVVHGRGALGQVAGAIVQGIGLACIDEWTPGQHGRGPATIHDHGVPRAPDAPLVSATFLDRGTDRTPRGLGELPIVPVAAAIANAVAQATGVRCTRTPLRPPEVWRRLRAANGESS
jgi:CO/xanthine dehydrogenase Mo-binding subunit